MSAQIKTRFYTFRQNNSGGVFERSDEDGIGIAVIVEAVDAKHANALARQIGLYFDGCETGQDCPCCGDRWDAVSERDATDEPAMYGVPIADAATEKSPYTWWGLPVFVHYMGDRGVERFERDDTA